MWIRKIVMPVLGVLFFILGVIGLMIPIVPQIPFFVAAFFCFAAASKRVNSRLKSSPLYEKYLRRIVERSRFLTWLLDGGADGNAAGSGGAGSGSGGSGEDDGGTDGDGGY